MKYLPILAVIILLGISAPDVLASSHDSTPEFGQFVNCEGASCSACNLVSMIDSIVKWLIGTMMVIFAIITAVAGFNLVTSGGNPQAKTAAKQKIMNAFIGIVIVLCAWLLVDTLMRALLSGEDGKIKDFGPWSSVTCGLQSTLADTVPGSAPGSGGVDDPDDPGDDPDTAVLLPKCSTVVTNTKPDTGLCEKGVASDVFGDGPWYWTCAGANGKASCLSVMAGAGAGDDDDTTPCGSVSGTSVMIPPNQGLCSNGFYADWTRADGDTKGIDGTYNWTCTSASGKEDKCSATRAVDSAKCGTADGKKYTKLPTTNSTLCEKGNPAIKDGVGDDEDGYNWTCQGLNLESVECQADREIVNQCIDEPGYLTFSKPSKPCAGGDVSWQDDAGSDGEYNWTCSGAEGPTKICSANVITFSECGKAANKDTRTLPTEDLCKGGSLKWYDKTASVDYTYNWSCTGTIGGEVQCAANKIVDGSCIHAPGTGPDPARSSQYMRWGHCASGFFKDLKDTQDGRDIWMCLGVNGVEHTKCQCPDGRYACGQSSKDWAVSGSAGSSPLPSEDVYLSPQSCQSGTYNMNCSYVY